MVKSPPSNTGGTEDVDLNPGSGRPPGGGNDTPLQYSYLETPRDRGDLKTAVHGVTKGRAWLSTHACTNAEIGIRSDCQQETFKEIRICGFTVRLHWFCKQKTRIIHLLITNGAVAALHEMWQNS